MCFLTKLQTGFRLDAWYQKSVLETQKQPSETIFYPPKKENILNHRVKIHILYNIIALFFSPSEAQIKQIDHFEGMIQCIIPCLDQGEPKDGSQVQIPSILHFI